VCRFVTNGQTIALTPVVRGRPLVLLVNCFRDERDMYVEYLQHVGFHPLHESKAVVALDTARSLNPDVIITDLVFPRGMNGIELIQQLRSTPETARIRIIVLSGLITPEIQQKAEDAGADRFLMKPCLPEVLVHQIRRVLGAGRRREFRRS
jgi:two-component system cell cycle response regulator DivK